MGSHVLLTTLQRDSDAKVLVFILVFAFAFLRDHGLHSYGLAPLKRLLVMRVLVLSFAGQLLSHL